MHNPILTVEEAKALPVYVVPRVRRCVCHRVDGHRCPALTKLRNFAIMTGHIHLSSGQLVPGSWVDAVKSKPAKRNSRKAR
jgi:hypothetical protein